MVGGLIDDEQGGREGGVDQIISLEQIDEKAREETQCMWVL